MIRKTFGMIEASVDPGAWLLQLRVVPSAAPIGVRLRCTRIGSPTEFDAALLAHQSRRSQLSRDQYAALEWAKEVLP